MYMSKHFSNLYPFCDDANKDCSGESFGNADKDCAGNNSTYSGYI